MPKMTTQSPPCSLREQFRLCPWRLQLERRIQRPLPLRRLHSGIQEDQSQQGRPPGRVKDGLL